MDVKAHTTPAKLERYSFLWSEVRLLVAAVALLIGGYPPILYFLPIPALYAVIWMGLKLAWLISGAASAYMLFRWYTGKQLLFGKKDTKDTVAFLVSVVSGINLGLVGLLGTNIGMSITNSYLAFVVVALMYLGSAVYLYQRWNSNGQKLF